MEARLFEAALRLAMRILQGELISLQQARAVKNMKWCLKQQYLKLGTQGGVVAEEAAPAVSGVHELIHEM